MRKYDFNSKYDKEELNRLNPEPWMIDLLSLNPLYVFWGPHEDYMWTRKGSGWNSAMFVDRWENLGLALDDLNEVVNFYFEIDRENVSCPVCSGPEGGNGIHPDGQWISESFHSHSSPFKARTFPSEETFNKYGPDFRRFCEEMSDGDGYWANKITQDELDALNKRGRCLKHNKEKPTVEEVNKVNNNGSPIDDLYHDAINNSILVETRCKRLGVPKTCPECDGHGYVYTAPKAHVNLILWLIHPRKGASRGVEIKNIQKENLEGVFKFLQEAARRNAERFEKVQRKVVNT